MSQQEYVDQIFNPKFWSNLITAVRKIKYWMKNAWSTTALTIIFFTSVDVGWFSLPYH